MDSEAETLKLRVDAGNRWLSLGIMLSQILAGTPPIEAVKHQILIMFLITAGTGFGTLVAVYFGARRLFDERERLRLDRLSVKKP